MGLLKVEEQLGLLPLPKDLDTRTRTEVRFTWPALVGQ